MYHCYYTLTEIVYNSNDSSSYIILLLTNYFHVHYLMCTKLHLTVEQREVITQRDGENNCKVVY